MKKLLPALLISLLLNSVLAQSSIDLDDMDISGDANYQSYDKQQSPSEQRKRLRKKLERKTEQLVEKQIQTLRLQREMLLQKRLKRIFDQQMKTIENIN